MAIKRVIFCIFLDGEPESVDRELADNISDPSCLVPFVYSLKLKRIIDLLPKVMGLPIVEGVFNFDIEKLMGISMTPSEKKDLIYQILSMNDSENSHNQLKRQIDLTNMLILQDDADLLLEVLELIIKKKAFHCKVLLRSILLFNKKDESKYFDRTKTMIKNMLEGGLTSLTGEQWINAKKGLVIYFLQNMSKKEDMSQLFTNSIKENIREEMLLEYDKLKSLT